ncbi:unnamed protein product, partial [Rotaria sp. Silwood1]
MDSSSSPS